MKKDDNIDKTETIENNNNVCNMLQCKLAPIIIIAILLTTNSIFSSKATSCLLSILNTFVNAADTSIIILYGARTYMYLYSSTQLSPNINGT
jgi:hypothetical protein